MQAETRVFEIGVAGLCRLPRCRYTAPDTPPEIDLIIEVDGQNEVAGAIVRQAAREIRLICGVADRANARPHADGGRFVCALIANLGTRRAKVRSRSLQRLIRAIDLRFQRIQLRIVKDCPPVALHSGVAWLTWLPPILLSEGSGRRLFEGGRNNCSRCLIFRPHHAAGKRHESQRNRTPGAFHSPPPFSTSTLSPWESESEGLRITWS